MVINNPKNKCLITLSEHLKTLFAVVKSIRSDIIVKKFTSPTAYFIHCDLIDNEQNLLNGEPSSVLALFDIKGMPYERFAIKRHSLIYGGIHLLENMSTV